MSRLLRRLFVAACASVALLAPSTVAHAAAPSKAEVLLGWTQTTAASTNAWNAARLDQGSWASYQFDWTTDYCSSSPDNPLGFRFNLSCYRHDFGYRNSKALGLFSGAKGRLDSAFYEDLKRVCATYNAVVRPACYSLAWTYYQAVRAFGSVIVSDKDIAKAARLLPQGAAVS